MSIWGRSWRLTKASWFVLRTDKELIVFPVVSLLGSAAACVLIVTPLITSGYMDDAASGGGAGWLFLAIFAGYFSVFFVVNFCNAALIGAALIRLRGGDPTAADGFKIALRRIGSILGFSLLSATLGVILQGVREKAGILGRLVAGLMAFSWGLATYFVIPVMIVEGVGPEQAIQRSTALLKRTWGEQLVGAGGLGCATGAIIAIAASIGLGLIILMRSVSAALLPVAALVVLGVFGLISLSSALNAIFKAALFIYANDRVISPAFEEDAIRNAFGPVR